jgi:hypothetical protein
LVEKEAFMMSDSMERLDGHIAAALVGRVTP